MGIWGFNPDYVTGWYVFNLPIEEILFFVCIPYACVFTYYCVLLFFNKLQPSAQTTNYITYLLIALAFLLFSVNFNKWYTATTSVFILGLLIYLHIKKVDFLGNFFVSYILIITPFLLSNGILTGSFTQEPVVWYNDNENIGIRAFTIPVEDFFYGMLLLLLNVSLFEVAKSRNIQHKL
jgi:lycopene cyclase domain-containing protein